MCGRFQLSVKGKQISERFNIEVFDELYTPSYNCVPSQKLPVITNKQPDRLSYFNWGLIPFWTKNPKVGAKSINTRSETISQKPSFKEAFKKQRCLIPANGYYEWKKGNSNTPYRIFIKDERIFTIAGIWDVWKDAENREIYTFSIITTKANSILENIHGRMPVILNPDDEKSWLQEDDEVRLKSLLKPYSSSFFDFYPISKAINSPKNNNPNVIIKNDDGQLLLF